MLTEQENKAVNEIVMRILDCMWLNEFYYVSTSSNITFDDVLRVKLKNGIIDSTYKDSLIVIDSLNNDNYERDRILSIARDNTIIIVKSNYDELSYPITEIDNCNYIKFLGKIFLIPEIITVPKTFKVLAIMHVYNEEDIIGKTINYLLEQGVDIFILDNWSADSTYNIIKELSEKNPDRVMVKRFPEHNNNEFNLYRQMEKTEELCREMDYDWVIHYDADEIRVSPWKNHTLLESIYYVDSLGFNLIENTVIDFKVTDDSNDNIFMQDGYFDFGHRKAHFEQIKTWKNVGDVELKSSGGHKAVIKNPRIYPLKILTKHYPFRTIEQAKKKLFRDRIPRFEKEKKSRGWHNQYDSYNNEFEIIQDNKYLKKWDNIVVNEYYIQLFFGVGINITDDNAVSLSSNIGFDVNKRIILYGAGQIGKKVYEKVIAHNRVVAWVDRNWRDIHQIWGTPVTNPEELNENNEYDYIIICLANPSIVNEISENLKILGVHKDKIKRIDDFIKKCL